MKFMRPKRSIVTLLSAGLLASCIFWLGTMAPNAEEDDEKAGLIGPPILAAAWGVVEVKGGLLKVTTPRDGVIASVLVSEGDQVKAGDVMATLDSGQEVLTAKIAAEEALQAEEQYKLLQMKMKNLSTQAERVKHAAAGKAVSDQALDEAIMARDSLAGELNIAASVLSAARMRQNMAAREVEIRTVRAPVDGFVIRQSIKVGEFATANAAAEMFTLLPNGLKTVRAEIPEQFLDNVKPGVPVEVLAEDRTGQSYPGRIDRISPVLMQSNGVASERNDVRTATSIVMISQDASFRVGQRVIIRVYK